MIVLPSRFPAKLIRFASRKRVKIKKLEPFAGVGVADRCREETEAEGHHENIQHEMLLMRARGGIVFTPSLWDQMPSRA
jgi:hypothetical protein